MCFLLVISIKGSLFFIATKLHFVEQLCRFSCLLFQDHKQPSDHLNMSRLDVKLETETSHSSPGATGEMVSGLQRMRQSINNVSSPPSGGGSGSLGQGDPFELQFSRVLQRVNQTIERNEIRLMEQDKREVIKLEWQQVALIADRVLLVCFVTATVTITGVVLFQSPPSAKV